MSPGGLKKGRREGKFRAHLDFSCQEGSVERRARRMEDEIEYLILEIDVYGRHGEKERV